jgi:hypothetical protein
MESLKKSLASIARGLTLMAIRLATRSWALLVLWAWFVAPHVTFAAPSRGGVMAFLLAITIARPRTSNINDSDASFASRLSFDLTVPLFALGMAWIVLKTCN